MQKSPSLRHNLRLKGYDYAQAGAYFVTIVTHNRLCLFGEVANGEMMLNPAGLMVAQVCQEIPLHIAGMEMDIFQIMPNHFHGIIILTGSVDTDRITGSVGATIPSKSVGADLRVCPGQPHRVAPTEDNPTYGNPIQNAPTTHAPSLPNIMQRFKSLTTTRYIAGVRNLQWKAFDRQLWQRNYYEHIIRDEHDLQTINEYILANPSNWDADEENKLM